MPLEGNFEVQRPREPAGTVTITQFSEACETSIGNHYNFKFRDRDKDTDVKDIRPIKSFTFSFTRKRYSFGPQRSVGPFNYFLPFNYKKDKIGLRTKTTISLALTIPLYKEFLGGCKKQCAMASIDSHISN